MAQLRQIAKPTRIAGKIAAAARRADPTGNVAAAKSPDKFDQKEGVMGESEGELITSTYTPGVEDELIDADSGRSSALKDEALETRNLVDTADAIGDLDLGLTREEVEVLGIQPSHRRVAMKLIKEINRLDKISESKELVKQYKKQLAAIRKDYGGHADLDIAFEQALNYYRGKQQERLKNLTIAIVLQMAQK
jgi:hypothetical protein